MSRTVGKTMTRNTAPKTAPWAGLVLVACGLASGPAAAQPASPMPGPTPGDVNIYSYREPGLIDPLLKAFTAKTGINAKVVFASAGLNERIAAEGRNSPADLLLTVDAGRLTEAKAAGLTQPPVLPNDASARAALEAAIPAGYRDADGHWFALTLRARVVYASTARVKQDAITYEELADPKWKGKICTRSGQHVYNTSLIATMIAHKGEVATEAWLRGVKANLVRKPSGGDREQVRDVFTGQCDLALVNTYYMAVLLKNPEQKAWAESVRMIFPNAGDRGAHINVSGMALTAHAPNKANALQLMVFLASQEGQSLYAEINNEYPVNPEVPVSAVVKGWGAMKPDALPLDNIGRYRKVASELVDKVGFDAGPGS